MSRVTFDTSKPVSRSIPLKASGEVIVPLIDSMYSDKQADSYEIPFLGTWVKAPIYVNVLNKGTIPNLPNGIAIETHVKVDGKGIHPIPKNAIPNQIYKCVMLPRIMRVEWALEANLKGGGNPLVKWLTMDIRTKA